MIVDAKTLPVAEEVEEELPKPPQLIGVVTEGRHPSVVFDEFIEGQPESEIDHPMRPEDPFCIQYTSGTTGKPKGVIASHLARIASATAAMEDFPIQHTDVLAVTTPLCHAAGLFTWFQPAMLAGATAVLMPGWHPEEFIQAVDRHQVTGAFVVPVQLRMLLDDPAFSARKLTSLQKIACGGAPASEELLSRAEAALPTTAIIQAYGSTEAGHVLCQHSEGRRRRPGSLGRPGSRFELKVFLGPGRPAAPGEVGELALRGPNLMHGYFEEPDETAAYFKSADGWGWTGDLGYADEEGIVTLVGRSKELIISGGMNIYPAELEDILTAHPDIAECAAFGVPDDHWGELPAAAVVLRAGAEVSDSEIIEYCAERVARFKRVRFVKFLESLPRTQSGKVKRKQLKERFARERS